MEVPQRFQGVLKVPRWCGDGLTCQLWECASEALEIVVSLKKGTPVLTPKYYSPYYRDPQKNPEFGDARKWLAWDSVSIPGSEEWAFRRELDRSTTFVLAKKITRDLGC